MKNDLPQLFQLSLCRVLMLALLAISATGCNESSIEMSESDADVTYQVGQAWYYDAREGEENSFLIIAQIDKDEVLGNIYHIAVHEIAIQNPMRASGVQENLPHSPVTLETLEVSSLRLAEAQVANIPDISEGHEIWKEAYDKGEAGAFTIPVKEIIQIIEDSLSSR